MELWITVIIILLAFPIIVFSSIKLKDWVNREDEKIEKDNTNIYDMVSNVSLDSIKYVLDKDTIDDINNLINKLIEEAANTYRILSVDNDTETITEKEAINITNYIKYKVSHNMTPTILASISLVYDISTPNKVSELLDEKIKIYMISMLVSRNKPQ